MKIHSSSWWDSVIRHELVQFNYDEVQKLYKGLIYDQAFSFVKLFLFVLYGCSSGVQYCPDLWRHYHYPYTFLPLNIVIQKYNQYTTVEPYIIGRSPFESCLQHFGYCRLINDDWYQICPFRPTNWYSGHWNCIQQTPPIRGLGSVTNYDGTSQKKSKNKNNENKL